MRIRLHTLVSLVLAAGLARPGLVQAQELTLQAYVDRTQIPLNQQFSLTVELSGRDAQRAPEPAVPDLSDFAVFLGTSSGMSTQIINSQISVSRTFTHRYVATKEGSFTIPAIQIAYRGKTFQTQPIPIQIVKAQTPGSRSSSNNLEDLLFLKALVNKRRVYQNEPVIVTYKIYTAVNIQSYGIKQLPNTVGFWSEEFTMPARPPLSSEIINGRRFRVATIRKIALFPQEPGEKTLDPMIVECEVRLPRQRRSRDPFESFFDDPFFSLGRTVTRSVASNRVKIEVLPLPEANRPLDFSGAVGRFTLSAEVDKSRVKTNEAVTFKLTISGVGNIQILPEPKVSWPSDFEVYDPKITEKVNRSGAQITGSKTYEYVLIPRYPGAQVIKPVSFSYFDLREQAYKTLSSPSIQLNVVRGDEPLVHVPMAASKEDVELIGQDIRFIQTRLPEFQRIGDVFYKRLGFAATLAFPLLALAGALVYRRHQERLSADVAYARSRKANQMALKRLRQANKALRHGDSKAFYAEVSKALTGFIADKLNVPAAGLITDEVASLLQAKNIRPETITQYLDCLRTCDFKRFAPTDADESEMKAFFEQARKAIIALEKEL